MGDSKQGTFLPWLALSLLWGTGTLLWVLFARDQQDHLVISFQNQLERTADELFRGHLEGRLGPDDLPQGVRAFAIYGADGTQAVAWGFGAPDQLNTTQSRSWRDGRFLSSGDSGWRDFIKVLAPLKPQLNFWGEVDPPPRGPPAPPGRNPPDAGRFQGFLFLRVTDGPLESRLWGWVGGTVVGSLVWAGFLGLVGLLWGRVRRYQTALLQHRELLQFAEASRTLSHELQNPLSAILLQTALLNRASSGNPCPEVAIIAEEAQRMSALVSRVRDFLKDPRGQAELVDLLDLAESLQGRFATNVEVQAEGAAPFLVLFDPHRLRSVVENLLKNAVESGPVPRPLLRLSRQKAGWVRLEILDSGRGFSADSLNRAKTPFFTTKTTGTGIGLAISDSFIKAAGGRLRLENRPEGGARVTVDLPEGQTQERT